VSYLVSLLVVARFLLGRSIRMTISQLNQSIKKILLLLVGVGLLHRKLLPQAILFLSSLLKLRLNVSYFPQ
jgi:hypothetical protein